LMSRFEVARPLDNWLYDRMVAGLQQPVDDRIVLVVADDKSLSALGRWPWSRSVHARLLNTLSAAKPRGIAFDVLFSEPSSDDADGDAALAQAMRQSGRVVSPVSVEPSQPGGPLIEVLPMPSLAAASAALGHVEVDVDADGVSRQAYLYAGLGSAHWPALALALYGLDPKARQSGELRGLRNPEAEAAPSPYLWNRDLRILLPYARGAGFQQVSYIDVLDGEIDPALLRDRWLLVGVTATGILRDVQVPLADNGNRMPGVEYHAQLLNALLQGNAIVPLTMGWQVALGIALALLPLLLHRPHHPILRPWVVAALGAFIVLGASALLLHAARLWFAPAACLLAILAIYIASILLHWRRSWLLASTDPLTRLSSRYMFDLSLDNELASARRNNKPLSLLLIDIDHFKAYNDYYGHQAGDNLLRDIGSIVQAHARRPRDVAARYGGDEMAVILPESSTQAAATVARSIQDEVRQQAVAHAQSPTAPLVTLSIGIATYYPILEAHEIDLLKRADAALYRAKREGRNRIHPPPDASLPD
ncbi:MAG: CHASE2 domain-containing protein, partial [Thermomonas sp.]|uniref:CHASE2 domain-containing protein n=1 Tax=Thermomonas sp. TaxID=1971895 RepID=UPI0039E5F194